MKRRTASLLAFTAITATIPLFSLAETVDLKGFIFATGTEPKLLAEPKAGAKNVASPPIGLRLTYKKVAKTGEAVDWYYVDQPGLGAGWLAAASSTSVRPGPLPPPKPIAKVPPPDVKAATGTVAHTSAARGMNELLMMRDSAMARGLSERALDARGLETVAEADAIVQQAWIDYTTLERRIGIQMSDPPHPTGQYANLTARGRKADAEAFAKTVQEGD